MIQINTNLAFGDLTLSSLGNELDMAATLISEIDRLETGLLNKINQRDALLASLWDKAKRVRAGVKATYGDDSSQFEMVGGTRISERKTPRRTVTPSV